MIVYGCILGHCMEETTLSVLVSSENKTAKPAHIRLICHLYTSPLAYLCMCVSELIYLLSIIPLYLLCFCVYFCVLCVSMFSPFIYFSVIYYV